MQVSLFKLRPNYNEEKKLWEVVESSSKMVFKDHSQMFKDIEKYRAAIPEEQAYNLYFGSFYSKDNTQGTKAARHGVFYDIICFDIDKIDLEKIEDYIDPICEELAIDRKKTAIVATGNGLQFVIRVHSGWDNVRFFKDNKAHYGWWCDKLGKRLMDENLKGDVDTSVFSANRILRFPLTINRKPIIDPFGQRLKENQTLLVKESYIFESNLELQEFEVTDTPCESRTSANALPMGSFGKPDHHSVLGGCDFLKWIKESPEEVHEPHVYAMLSITAQFDDNNQTSNELFNPLSSPSIDSMDLPSKIEQAKTASGPRTCENISTLFAGCGACPNWGKCTSPIQIKGEDFIATEEIGFTTYMVTANGRRKIIRHLDDLYLAYKKEFSYKHLTDVKRILNYDETHFIPTYEPDIMAYAEQKYIPKPTQQERSDFLNKIKVNELEKNTFIDGSRNTGLMNLKNGVLDIRSGALLQHDPGFGFRSVLPFEYDEQQTECPTYDKLMNNLTLGRKELIDILEEYMAFIISGMPYRFQKFLILSGAGNNGKTTFINLVRSMVGEGNYSSLEIATIAKDQFGMAGLDGKLVNFSEEEPVSCFSETGNLKKITGDSPIRARNLYESAFEFTNRAKVIMSYNEVPYLSDTSKGMQRRMLVIPFDLNLEETPDAMIENLPSKLKNEMSAIFKRILKAHKRLLENGFTQSSIVDKEVSKMVRDSDAVQEWFNDFCEVTEDSRNRVSYLAAYQLFRSENQGESKLTLRGFTKKMKGLAKPKGFDYSVVRSGDKVERNFIKLKILTSNNVTNSHNDSAF